MIDKLRNIAIFSTVVDKGTFKAAAKQLGLAPSRVSEAVSDLEKYLDVTLLYRSTRKLSLTSEGRVLHEKAQHMLTAVESGIDEICPSAKAARGELSVTVPAFLTQTFVLDSIAGFAELHPQVKLNIDFTDRRRNVIGDGFDVAIRAGWLEDSELMSRSIGSVNRLLVASPDYVESKCQVNEPADLENWDWIGFAMREDQIEFSSVAGDTVVVKGSSTLLVNSADSLYEFCVRGRGVTLLPETKANRAISRGELVQVLPGWSVRPLGLFAVWPNQSRRQNLALNFVRHLGAATQPEQAIPS